MKKLNKILAGLAIAFVAVTTTSATPVMADTVLHLPVAHGQYLAGSDNNSNSTTSTSGTGAGTGVSIPGMPDPSTGFSSSNTTTDLGTWIGAKTKIGLTILFSVATLILIGVGVFKGMKLSTSNARNRAEAISDLMWWFGGAAVSFGAALITGMVYIFTTK